MMPGRQWGILARKTMDFLLVAEEYHFCVDLAKEIKRRLFAESPFPSHHKNERRKIK